MKYDGMLFGNGLSLNLIKQLQPLVSPDKCYLFNIDNFLKAFINKRLSEREERRIFKIFYKSKELINLRCFERIRSDFAQYYNVHNANIEYWLGVDLFNQDNCGYNFSSIMSLIPGIYNIWHEIMIDYLTYLNLNKSIKNFESTVMSILDRHSHVYTTNFDRLFEDLQPEHLHGIFVKGYKKFKELIFSYINDERFYYKCIWGWNGIGKLEFINQIKEIDGFEKYFDFNFFFDKSFNIKNLLIYGMGFQNSGYIEELSESMYKQPTVGGIIDEHILIRLKGLQTQGQLQNITFAYYSDSDKQHYDKLSSCFELKQVDYIKSSSFSFSI